MSTTAGSPSGTVPDDTSASPARRPSRRIVLIALGIVALIAATVWLARWWTVGRFIESTDDAYLQADSVTVAPKVTLFGDLGFSASDPGHLARQSNFSWIGVPYLQWNVLDFGRTLGSVHAAEASRDEAQAHYTKAVLGALQDANSSLSRYGHQREHLVTLQKVETSAGHSATLMRQRYSAGVSTLIDLLDTQREEFTAQQNVVTGQAELLKDFVSLQKSLGLGWRVAQG